MKIGFVSGHSCIRVQKQAIPLVAMGHEVHLITRKLPSFPETYTTISKYENQDQLRDALKVYADTVDVWHCHNEPSFFVMMVKEVSKAPVVLDVHDTFLTRSTPEEWRESMEAGRRHVRITAEERASFQLADGLVFVSDTVKEAVLAEFELRQPCTVLPSYVPRGLYKYQFGEWLGGLTYEGKVTLPSEHGEDGGTGFHYCDYLDVTERASERGMDFHLYAGREDEKFKEAYGKAILHPPLPYPKLLQAVSRHDWGLVGNLVKSPQWHQTLPNKLFDYIAAGVPVVSINASASSEFLRSTGFGISVDSVDTLADMWAEHRECRNKLLKHRGEWAMEEHIGNTLRLYGELT